MLPTAQYNSSFPLINYERTSLYVIVIQQLNLCIVVLLNYVPGIPGSVSCTSWRSLFVPGLIYLVHSQFPSIFRS